MKLFFNFMHTFPSTYNCIRKQSNRAELTSRELVMRLPLLQVAVQRQEMSVRAVVPQRRVGIVADGVPEQRFPIFHFHSAVVR